MGHLFLESYGSETMLAKAERSLEPQPSEFLQPHFCSILLVKVSHKAHLDPRDREIDSTS